MSGHTPAEEARPARSRSQRGRRWAARLGLVVAAGSMIVLAALGALWGRSLWVSEALSSRQGWIVPASGGSGSTVGIRDLHLMSGAGVAVLWWRLLEFSGVDPIRTDTALSVLRETTWLDNVPMGTSWIRFADAANLSRDRAAVGPGKTLQWVWAIERYTISLGPVREFWGRVAIPYWVLMVPFAVPPVWWLWCPRGRARPRLTTRRAMLAIAAFAVVLANAVPLWHASAEERASEWLDSVHGSIEYLVAPPGSGEPDDLRIRLDTPMCTDADLASFRSTIAALPRARALCLGAGISDAGLEHLAGLTRLQWLELKSPRVTSAGLRYLEGLHDLQILQFWRCQITDSGLAHLRPLTRLRRLDLEDTRISDRGLSVLAGLTGLRDLNLDGTAITDAGLAHLKPLTRLRVLHTSRTGVTDAGLAALEPAVPTLALRALERSVRRGNEQAFRALTRTRHPERRRAFRARLEREIDRHPDGQSDDAAHAFEDTGGREAAADWVVYCVSGVEVHGPRAVVTDGRCQQVMVYEDGRWKADLDDPENVPAL